jgi:hypothetical protein
MLLILPAGLWLLGLVTSGARAQDESRLTDDVTRTRSTTASSTITESDDDNTSVATYSALSFTNSYRTLTGSEIPTSAFTGSDYTYVMVTGQRTVDANAPIETDAANSTSSAVNSQITASQESVSLTVIAGVTLNANNRTVTPTSSAAAPTNTVPCNGWPEFCNRKYSNITFVTSHNAAFSVPRNAASNQEYPIRVQLNDGIRMLQGQVHWINDTLWNCHTSCDQLNAGKFQAELEVVRDWLQDHPYDVLTILIGNSEQTDVTNFVPAFTNAGLLPYVYKPTLIPQFRDQWPTLGEMIIRNQRLVVFMDFKADQARVPYILDQFSHIWETPFSPVDQAFPCDQQRPPGLNQTLARDQYMYLANHNLNTAVDLSSIGFGSSEPLLIPNTAELNLTNGQQNQFGRLGAMSLNCTGEFSPPPLLFSFLLLLPR